MSRGGGWGGGGGGGLQISRRTDDSLAVRVKYILVQGQTHTALLSHLPWTAQRRAPTQRQADSDSNTAAAEHLRSQALDLQPATHSRHFGVPLPPLISVSFSSLPLRVPSWSSPPVVYPSVILLFPVLVVCLPLP